MPLAMRALEPESEFLASVNVTDAHCPLGGDVSLGEDGPLLYDLHPPHPTAPTTE